MAAIGDIFVFMRIGTEEELKSDKSLRVEGLDENWALEELRTELKGGRQGEHLDIVLGRRYKNNESVKERVRQMSRHCPRCGSNAWCEPKKED